MKRCYKSFLASSQHDVPPTPSKRPIFKINITFVHKFVSMFNFVRSVCCPRTDIFPLEALILAATAPSLTLARRRRFF